MSGSAGYPDSMPEMSVKIRQIAKPTGTAFDTGKLDALQPSAASRATGSARGSLKPFRGWDRNILG